MKLKQREFLIIVSIIIFYFIIAHTGIMTLDDFRWGSSRGLERLYRNFDNYNGRYLGNYSILLMTRSYLAKVLIQVTINTGIVLLIYNLLEKKVNLSIIMVGFVAIPIDIYSQTYGWLSGFANYNIVVFLLLLIIYFISNENSKTSTIFLIFTAGLATQLFLENISVVNILLSLLFLLFSFFKKRKRKIATSLFLSNLLGFVIMFANSAYITNDTSRGISNINFDIIINSFLTQWSDLFFKNNLFLLLAFMISAYLISNKKNIIFFSILPITIYFGLRYLFNISWQQVPTKLLYAESFLMIIFIAIILLSVWFSNIVSLKQKIKFYLFFTIAGLYSGPILLLTKNGQPFISARNVFTTYVFLWISVLILIISIVNNRMVFKYDIYIIATAFSLATMLVIGTMSSTNYILDKMRIKAATNQIEQGIDNIEIQQLPFRNLYFAWPFYEEHGFMRDFKEFYNFPENIEINEVSPANKYTND